MAGTVHGGNDPNGGDGGLVMMMVTKVMVMVMVTMMVMVMLYSPGGVLPTTRAPTRDRASRGPRRSSDGADWGDTDDDIVVLQTWRPVSLFYPRILSSCPKT